jgi:hypothetical protein
VGADFPQYKIDQALGTKKPDESSMRLTHHFVGQCVCHIYLYYTSGLELFVSFDLLFKVTFLCRIATPST